MLPPACPAIGFEYTRQNYLECCWICNQHKTFVGILLDLGVCRPCMEKRLRGVAPERGAPDGSRSEEIRAPEAGRDETAA